MKCCENVIVTVQLHPGTRTLDMELPAFLPIEALESRLLETLREMDPLNYGSMTTALFRCNGRQLENEMTLAKAGIWDGAILDVRLSEGA